MHKSKMNKLLQTGFNKIFDNNKGWVLTRTVENANYFENLSRGQNLPFLQIQC